MNVFGMFVKLPRPGQVKTRLAEACGDARAAELYAAFVTDLVLRFRDAGDRRVLCYAPATEPARRYFQSLAGTAYDLWPQPAVSLGERMRSFFHFSWEQGAAVTVLIGSDSPTLPVEFAAEAFARLAAADCVLGPATDGGYYLMGQRAPGRDLFSGIEWSTPSVLEQTVSRCRDSGAKLTLLPPWYDVDTASDLAVLRGHLAGLNHSRAELRAENTARALGGIPPHAAGDYNRGDQ